MTTDRTALQAASIRKDTRSLTLVAMLCFAANSLLCRLALASPRIDPASFTSVRIISAAVMLLVLLGCSRRGIPQLRRPAWRSVATLFAYAVMFSFAYARLGAGTGALILFGTVQLTMFAVALRRGERFSLASWMALGVAILALIYLVLPGLSAPDPFAAALMAGAGMAWGGFSVLGRSVRDSLEANATNFTWCVPPAIVMSLFTWQDFHITGSGLLLALASGAVASGLGYVVWYAALRGLSRTHAATIQLSVPILAAFGGVLFLSEALTTRLLVASVFLLGAIAVIVTRPPATIIAR